MPEIKIEYPKGKRTTEMMLVEMLNEKRCWADYMEISQALWNIRFHAKQMEKEHEVLCSSAVSGENTKA